MAKCSIAWYSFFSSKSQYSCSLSKCDALAVVNMQVLPETCTLQWTIRLHYVQQREEILETSFLVMGIMQSSSNTAISCGQKMQFNRKVVLIPFECTGWNAHLSKGFCTLYLLSLQVGIKYGAVRGWPCKLMGINPATTPREVKAEDELKSPLGRRAVPANCVYNSLKNTLSVFGLEIKSSPAALVLFWEERTQL